MAKIFIDWFYVNPLILISLIFPATVTISSLAYTIRKSGFRHVVSFLPAWIICTAASYFGSFWTTSEGLVQMHIIQVFFIWVAICAYRKIDITPLLAFALTFLSNLCVDVVQAYIHAPTLYGTRDAFYIGIGGGGFYDALIVFPTTAALVIIYAAWRRSYM